MNKDRIKGAAKTFAGRIQEKVGKWLGSEKSQARGLKNQFEGKVQQHVGALKEYARRAGKR